MPATKPGGFTRAVAASLRERRAYLEWTQQELASRTDISQSHISQILKGHKHIHLDQFGQMCDAMDLDPVAVIERAWSVAVDDMDHRIAAEAADMQQQLDEPERAEQAK